MVLKPELDWCNSVCGWGGFTCRCASHGWGVVLAAERLSAFIFIYWLALPVLLAGTAMLYFSPETPGSKNWARHSARFTSLPRCHLSFVSPSPLISNSVQHLSLLSHKLSRLPLLPQSGLMSLWQLANSITNKSHVLPMIVLTPVIIEWMSHRHACSAPIRHFTATTFVTSLMSYWVCHYFHTLFCENWNDLNWVPQFITIRPFYPTVMKENCSL